SALRPPAGAGRPRRVRQHPGQRQPRPHGVARSRRRLRSRPPARPSRRPSHVVNTRPPVALTIAGTDSGGGAGVSADLATFAAHGVWGTLAVVAVTAQNTLGVQDVATLSPALVRAQIASVVTDLGVDATKTGMLATAELVSAVVAAVRELGLSPLVV